MILQEYAGDIVDRNGKDNSGQNETAYNISVIHNQMITDKEAVISVLNR